MIERIVLVKLHDDHVPNRAAIARTSEDMLARVPGVDSVQATVPGDGASAESWDLCLRLRFADLATVQAYVPHPVHEEYLSWIGPRAVFKKAWNFTTPG